MAAEEKEAIVIGHTHDEILNEVDDDKAEAFAGRLKETMIRGFDWTEGLPLKTGIETSWYYHK